MTIQRISTLGLACVLFLQTSVNAEWSQFRGAQGQGTDTSSVPLEWSPEGKNIAWSAELPGRGPSGPIVVKGRVYVTASTGENQDRMHVLCFDANDGSKLWHRQFWATGRTMVHPTSGNAAPTPASDGDAIYAFYSSNDLVCLDLDGNLRWFRGLAYDFPKAGNDIGMASSPVAADGTVVVQVENQGDSFVSAIDTETGETRWQVERPKKANWSSPLIVQDPAGKYLALVKSTNGLDAFDLRSGLLRWTFEVEAGGIPSLSSRDGEILLPADGLTALKIPLGDETPQIRWSSNRLKPGSASPVVSQSHVFTMNSAGVLACASLTDGKVLWQLRVGGSYWATPVLAGQHMYCINDRGEVNVVDVSGEKGKIVATNKFGETIQASPAVAGDAMFVRSNKHLWKVAATN